MKMSTLHCFVLFCHTYCNQK